MRPCRSSAVAISRRRRLRRAATQPLWGRPLAVPAVSSTPPRASSITLWPCPRDLLATRVARDPEIPAFRACWVYEELWHGAAFPDFLRPYGIEVPAEPKLPDGRTPLPSRPGRTERIREGLGVGHKLAILPSMVGSALMRDFVALHMTWGAINELTT